MHISHTLGFRGTGVSYQFNIRHYVCRNVPLVHFSTSMLLIPGFPKYFHRHVTPISRNRIVLTHPPRGTKFPNHHNFIISFLLPHSLLLRLQILSFLLLNRQVTESERGLRIRPRGKEPLASPARAYMSWQPTVRTNDRTTARTNRPTLTSMKGNNESCTKKGFRNEHAIFRQQWRKRRKEIGMALFWDRPIVCSHLASDSLWYDEVD